MNPLIIIAVIVGGVILVRHLTKSVDEETRQYEEEWAIRQFSRILAKHTGQPETSIFEKLKAKEPIAFSPDFKRATLQYELTSSTHTRKLVLKRLVVSFTDTEVSVETEIEWTDLPAEIRNELLQTGQTVQRNFS
jgi:ABC-type uncharacterized transport system auxiliary subunit